MAEKDTKKKGVKKQEKLGVKIFNVAFWIIIAVLFATWITDFIMFKIEKNPFFCVYKKTHEFDDGTVEQCSGLGYKVYDYKRDSIKKTEFGPFFIKMK